jgi:hypothetical protein
MVTHAAANTARLRGKRRFLMVLPVLAEIQADSYGMEIPLAKSHLRSDQCPSPEHHALHHLTTERPQHLPTQ